MRGVPDAMSEADTNIVTEERVISKYFAGCIVKDGLPPGVRVDVRKQRTTPGSMIAGPLHIRKISKPRVVSPLATLSYSHKAEPMNLG